MSTITEWPASTQPQRGEIIRLMRQAELDTRRITLMHRRIGVQDHWMNKPVDAWMCSLSEDAASGVIKTLEARV